MNYSLSDLLLVFFLGLMLWLLWRYLGFKQVLLARVRQHCKEVDIQLLDDSIVINRLNWQQGIEWVYSFDYSIQGDERRQGLLVVRKGKIKHILLDRLDQ